LTIVTFFGSYFLPVTPKTLRTGFWLNTYNAVKTANESFFYACVIVKKANELFCLYPKAKAF